MTHSIVDIGGSKINSYLRDRIQSSLIDAKTEGRLPYLPEELVFENGGLDIWGEIIYLPEYYQTHDEVKLLKQNSAKIASYIPPGATLVDLGAGLVCEISLYSIAKPPSLSSKCPNQIIYTY